MAGFYTYPEDALAGRDPVQGITIDGPTTKDMDDAIHVEEVNGKTVVTVTIADVASGVYPGSANDLIAFHRGETAYLSDGNITMLPGDLTEDRFSLVPHKARPAVSVKITLNKALEIEDVDVFRSAVTSSRKWTYDDYTDAINGGDPQAAPWYQLAEQLLQKRREGGALFFYDLKQGVSLDDEGRVVVLQQSSRKAQILIQELMILANRVVPIFARKNNIPILYRNHQMQGALEDTEREQLVARLQSAREAGDLQAISQIRSSLVEGALTRALYGPDLIGHDGLNIKEGYCHFTSPIRRYADLITHRNIIAHLEGRRLPYTVSDLRRMAVHLNEVRQIRRDRSIDADREQRYRTAVEAVTTRSHATRDEARRALKMLYDQPAPPATLEKFYLNEISHGKPMPEALAYIVTLSPRDATAWNPLRRAALDYLCKNPQDTIGVLSLTHQKQPDKWIVPHTFRDDSPSEAQHQSTLEVTTDNDIQRVKSPIRPLRKEAQYAAALIFLHQYCGLPVPEKFTKDVLPAVARPPRRGAPKGPNYIGMLEEFGNIADTKATYEIENRSGPAHAPIFNYTVTVAGISLKEPVIAKGSGETAVAARQDAARAALEALGIDISEGVVTRQTLEKQGWKKKKFALHTGAEPIGAMFKACKYINLPVPKEGTGSSGPHDALVHSCRFETQVAGEKEPLVGSGAASTKAVARKEAARNLLQRLLDKGLIEPEA